MHIGFFPHSGRSATRLFGGIVCAGLASVEVCVILLGKPGVSWLLAFWVMVSEMRCFVSSVLDVG